MSTVLSEIKAQAGRLGGLATASRHDHQFYQTIGRMGVRARGIEPLIDREKRIRDSEKEEKLRANKDKLSLSELRQAVKDRYFGIIK